LCGEAFVQTQQQPPQQARLRHQQRVPTERRHRQHAGATAEPRELLSHARIHATYYRLCAPLPLLTPTPSRRDASPTSTSCRSERGRTSSRANACCRHARRRSPAARAEKEVAASCRVEAVLIYILPREGPPTVCVSWMRCGRVESVGEYPAVAAPRQSSRAWTGRRSLRAMSAVGSVCRAGCNEVRAGRAIPAVRAVRRRAGLRAPSTSRRGTVRGSVRGLPRIPLAVLLSLHAQCTCGEELRYRCFITHRERVQC
jgi:hypothetical protein